MGGVVLFRCTVTRQEALLREGEGLLSLALGCGNAAQHPGRVHPRPAVELHVCGLLMFASLCTFIRALSPSTPTPPMLHLHIYCPSLLLKPGHFLLHAGKGGPQAAP